MLNVQLYVWAALALGASAQSVCPTPVAGSIPSPSTAPGWESKLVATGLTTPRGIIFDSSNHLLVIERGVGLTALTLQDDGGSCLSVTNTKTVIDNANLNHAVELTNGGKTLLVSDVSAVYQYTYDPVTASVTAGPKTLVNGMYNGDHSTRTILASKFKPGTIVVNRGSQSNIDTLASNKTTGHAQVKAFNINNVGSTPYDFASAGQLLAWGVRNDVGIAEHPGTGGIWTVENSVDDISRDGTQFNQQNPGEKLNYMGTLLNNKSPNQGSNFGYPQCFAAWAPGQVPQHGKLQVGQQFSIDSSITDKQCQTTRTAPELVFNAHMAPLDIKFGAARKFAYVSFHGSFDRPVPQGYKVSQVAFGSDGFPTAPSTSRTAVIDLVRNQNFGSCPQNCFRPVGLAFDHTKKRLFFSSDATGEIYVLRDTS